MPRPHRGLCVEAEPDDEESAPPLALERSCVRPTVGAWQHAREGRDGRVGSEHPLQGLRQRGRLSDQLGSRLMPDSAQAANSERVRAIKM